MHECPCFQLVINLKVTFISDVNLQIETVHIPQELLLALISIIGLRVMLRKKKKNLNYSERQEKISLKGKQEGVNGFSELQPHNK